MTETTQFADLKTKTQLGRFLVVGFSAVATDLIVYYLLLTLLPHSVAKTFSFISGTFVAYIFNKHWTFEQPGHNRNEIIRFIILYTLTLGANVLTNYTTLSLFPAYVFLAFLVATGVSTVLNFIGQKWWVFKK